MCVGGGREGEGSRAIKKCAYTIIGKENINIAHQLNGFVWWSCEGAHEMGMR